MYCSACGQAVDPYQPYCPRCGRQVTPIATPTPPPWTWSRVHRHVHTLGILWVAYAGYMLLRWVLILPFLAGIFHGWDFPGGRGFDLFFGPWMMRTPWFFPLVTAILTARAILCVVTGVALLKRLRWARPLAIVTAILTLIRPITGTLLSIYTLWVLLPSASGDEYEGIATS